MANVHSSIQGGMMFQDAAVLRVETRAQISPRPFDQNGRTFLCVSGPSDVSEYVSTNVTWIQGPAS